MPRIIGLTALTTVVSWSATTLLTRAATPTTRPEEAIAISVESDPARIMSVNPQGRSMVIPATVRTTGTPGTGCTGFHQWGARNGGVDAGLSTIQVVAQGRSDSAVLITTMNVVVLSKTDPVPGIWVHCPTGGDAQMRSITVDLDATPPKVSYLSSGGAPFGFTLANGETETFIVSARSSHNAYRWRLELGVVVDGKQKTIAVGPPDGFVTTPEPEGVGWVWSGADEWDLLGSDGMLDHSRTSPGTAPLPRP